MKITLILNRFVYLLLFSALLITVTGSACCAAGSNKKLSSGSGKKKLLLFAKNPVTWKIIKNGGHGTLIYRESAGTFMLAASGLAADSAYALVWYTDSPHQGTILARGMSDQRGKLSLSGVWKNWTKKFWLVSGEDVAGSVGDSAKPLAWRPDRYLFEEKPLGVPCNCPEPEEP